MWTSRGMEQVEIALRCFTAWRGNTSINSCQAETKTSIKERRSCKITLNWRFQHWTKWKVIFCCCLCIIPATIFNWINYKRLIAHNLKNQNVRHRLCSIAWWCKVMFHATYSVIFKNDTYWGLLDTKLWKRLEIMTSLCGIQIQFNPKSPEAELALSLP